MRDIPSSSFAPMTARKRIGRFVAVGVLSMAVSLAASAFTAAFVIWPRIEARQNALLEKAELRAAAAEARAAAAEEENALLKKEVRALEDEIMVPPTNDKMFSILSQGLGVTEDVYLTSAAGVGTTPAAAFTTDLTAAQQSNAFTQEALIQNTHATQNLCVKPIAWSGVTTCTARCAASGYTCSGAATDGWRLVAGQAMEFRWDGTVCACVVGSAAGTTFQSRRAVR